MPLFRCLIVGENFPFDVEGEIRMLGFATTRFIEADSTEAAPEIAHEQLRDEPTLQVPADRPGREHAVIRFEEIVEVEIAGEDTALAFFPMQADG